MVAPVGGGRGMGGPLRRQLLRARGVMRGVAHTAAAPCICRAEGARPARPMLVAGSGRWGRGNKGRRDRSPQRCAGKGPSGRISCISLWSASHTYMMIRGDGTTAGGASQCIWGIAVRRTGSGCRGCRAGVQGGCGVAKGQGRPAQMRVRAGLWHSSPLLFDGTPLSLLGNGRGV